MLTKVLYNNDNPSTLTQEQKDTLSTIIRIGTTTAAVATTGEVSGAVNAGEVGRVGVQWNAASAGAQARAKNKVQQAECRQLGISSDQCSAYHGEKNLESLIEIGLFLIPTTKEELVITLAVSVAI